MEVREKIISLNKSYDVYIDGICVGNISGKYVNITGDVFTLKDIDGNVLMSEKQIKRWGIKLNRLAKIYDETGKTIGYFGEDRIRDIFSMDKYRFHIYDENKNEYAHTDQRILSLLYKNEIKDNTDKVIYTIDKDLSLLTDVYTITKTGNSSLSMDKAIFLTCIFDAIMDENDK